MSAATAENATIADNLDPAMPEIPVATEPEAPPATPAIEEAEAPPETPQPEVKVQPPDLVAQAKALNLTESEIASLGDNLQTAVYAIYRQRATAQPPAQQPAPEQQRPAQPPAFKPIVAAIPEDIDPDMAKAFNTFVEQANEQLSGAHARAEAAEARSRQVEQAISVRPFVQRFDQWIEKSSGLADVLGSGPSEFLDPASLPLKSRVALTETARQILGARTSIGGQMTLEQAWDAAASALYPEKTKPITTTPAAALQEREGQITARPNQRAATRVVKTTPRTVKAGPEWLDPEGVD